MHGKKNKKRRRKNQRVENVNQLPHDPEQEKQQQRQEKRRAVVIAEDETTKQKAAHPRASTDEAFDDLDLLDYDMDEQQQQQQEDEEQPQEDADGHRNDEDRMIAAQRIAQMPMVEAARGWKMVPFLVETLQRQEDFAHFFPIQALAIPDVLASERHPHVRARDVCLTAPTGSGKTLAYVLPILNALAQHNKSSHNNNGNRRLCALVVLPSRDLATQVHRVFETFVKGQGEGGGGKGSNHHHHLKVGLAMGQSDFVQEQKDLTVIEEDCSGEDDIDMLRNRSSYDPGDLKLALKIASQQQHQQTWRSSTKNTPRIPAHGWSNVDILVCTPGRLVDHLDKTAGFTLQHLRFLVVDEADRLLSQSYHNWIDRVLEASNAASIKAWKNIKDDNNSSSSSCSKLPPFQLAPDRQSVRIEPITWRRGGTDGDQSDHFNTNDDGGVGTIGSAAAACCRPVQLRKFLVSATLTRDPQKLAALRLVNPQHFNVHSLAAANAAAGENAKKYALPAGLMEHTVECTAEQKPLVLMALLLDRLQQQQQQQQHQQHKRKTVIVVFTSSLDSTHRLARLLQLLWASRRADDDDDGAVVGEFSSALSQSQRTALLQRCNDVHDPLAIVVCSDGMSRGMDIDFVDTVINYDVPTLAKTYLHRCGRTARGSRRGTAISLLKGGQVSLFRRMRQLIQGSASSSSSSSDHIRPMSVKKNLIRDMAGAVYRQCIQALRDILDAEENGELGHTEPIPDEYMPEQQQQRA